MHTDFEPQIASRLALSAREGQAEYNAHKGSTMRELLRARRRASRFGGPDRRSYSPHAPEHLREAAAVRVLGLDERAVKVEKGAAQGRSRRRQGGRGSESQGGGD